MMFWVMAADVSLTFLSKLDNVLIILLWRSIAI